MLSRPRLIPLTLVVAVAVSRFAFRSHYLYDVDSVNFALGIRHFDPAVHQPHPPGYFLYICLGRLLNAVLHDANLAFVVLGIAASCAAVLLIYQLASDWFGSSAAAFAGAIFLFSPLFWFHGTVALTYIVEAFFSVWLGSLCWRVYCGREAFAVPAAIVLGLSAGVRPSSLAFLAPLFLFALLGARWRARLLALATLALTLAAWFVPMLMLSGGWDRYFDALISLWHRVPAKTTIFDSSPLNSIARAFAIVFIYLICFGAASLAPLVALLRPGPADDTRKRNFILVWIAPALCFFVFGYLIFVNSGYLLIIFTPLCLWMGSWLAQWYDHAAWKKPLKIAVIAASAVANVAIFLFAPFYCSYRSVRQFEAELKSIQATLPLVAPARDTVIVAFDSHFLGFRHAGYYLPQYLTLAYPAARTMQGQRIFAMSQRNTHLLAQLPETRCTRFVLFPLPAQGQRYRLYLQKVEKLLPSRDLTTISLNGHTYVTGPIRDLPLLFSTLPADSASGVYAPSHSGIQPVNSRSH